MRSAGRGRRLLTGTALVAAALLAWDQNGVLTSHRAADVAGAVYTRPLPAGSGFHALGRLRIDGAPTPIAESASAAPLSAPAPVAAPRPGESVIAPPPAIFDAPPAPAPPPPAPLRTSSSGERRGEGGTWAVMIGVNDYPGTRHDLRSAVADVQDVNDALARMGVPGTNRLLIRDGQATAGTIRKSLEWLRDNAGRDAVAVFFWAGHVRKLDGDTEAMVGADGSLVSDADLAGLLRGVAAQRMWIGIAGCYGGGFTEALGEGRILTGASGANELAYENEKMQRSYLVEYMVRRAMIENRASSSVEAAFAWARSEIARDYPNRVPVQYDHNPGEMDLRQPGTAAAQPPPPSGESPPSTNPPPSTTAPPPKEDEEDGCEQLTIGIIRCGG